MKQLSDGLTAHLAQDVTTMATGWRVQRRDGQVFGWVDHDLDVTIAGVTYLASQGLRPTSVRSTDDLSVDTLDVSIFLTVGIEHDLVAGVWDDAEVIVFEYNWSVPPAALDTEVIILRAGHLGELSRTNGVLTAEIRGLTQRLSTRIGRTYTQTCPWRHGRWNPATQTYQSSAECTIDAEAFTRSGLVSGLGDTPVLECTDTTNGEPEGFFNEGLLTFTGGPNANVTREIRRWTNQTFTLYRPFPFAMAVGDPYRALAGDDKTATTCRDRFQNLLNFGGFPFIPGAAAVFSSPTMPG
jgi:uncharacterized phage protein (TIGR02218 family)